MKRKQSDDGNAISKKSKEDSSNLNEEKIRIKYLTGRLEAKQTQLETIRAEKEKSDKYKETVERMITVLFPDTGIGLDKFEQALITAFQESHTYRQLVQSYRLRETELVISASQKEKKIKSLKDQIAALKQDLKDSSSIEIRRSFTDSIINANYTRSAEQVKRLKKDLESTQNELTLQKFSTHSQTGRKLIKKCEKLQNENTEFAQRLRESKPKQQERRIEFTHNVNQRLITMLSETQQWVLKFREENNKLKGEISRLKHDQREKSQ